MTDPQAPSIPSPPTDIDVIDPSLARIAIEQAIHARLGPDWNDEETGWAVIHDGDYLIRLTRGVTNLDFECDLLGEVTIIERPINPLQASGRLIAWMVLISSLFLAFLLANIAGVFR